MEAQAAAPAQPNLRVFEPERAHPPAKAEFVREDFSEREIGILCEQGNFERARILLSKRAVAQREDASAYLDAIRMERSAAPGGAAWQAWLSRALAVSAQVAAGAREVLPEAELRAYLLRQNVGWATLAQQKDAAAARELLRLRLEQQVAEDPDSALAAVEDPALHRAAQRDPQLGRLALGVMAAAAWRFPARVTVLAPQYGIDLKGEVGAGGDEASDGASGSGSGSELRALLAVVLGLQGSWAAVLQQEECPQALERFVRAGKVLGRERGRELLAALAADLRARPRDYLRCAETMVRVSPALAAWLCDALQQAHAELSGASALAQTNAAAAAEDPELARRIAASARAVQGDPLTRLWPGSIALTAAGLGLAWLWAGPVAALYAPLVLLLLPLRRSLDALLYRRNLRGALLACSAALGLPASALGAALQRSSVGALRRLAPRASADAALVLVGEIARAGGALADRTNSEPQAGTVPA